MKQIVRDNRGRIIGKVEEVEEVKQEMSPHERLTLGMAKNREAKRKEIGVIINRCEVLAQQARKKKDAMPHYNFQARLEAVHEIRAFLKDYEGLKKEACGMAEDCKRYQPEPDPEVDENFLKTVYAHFEGLNSSFDIEGNYSWKLKP